MKKILFFILVSIYSFSQNPSIKYNIIHFDIPITNNEALADVLENHPNIEKKSENKYFFSKGKVNNCKNTSWFLSNENVYFDIKITDKIEIYNIRFENSIQINLGYASTSRMENSLENYSIKNNGELRKNSTFIKNYECLESFFKSTFNQ